MTFTLETQKLLEPDLTSSTFDIDPLTQETGWSEVAKGLTRVLMGYLLSFVCMCLGAALIGWLIYQGASGALDTPEAVLDAGTVLLLGGCIIGLLSLVSYGLILTGKWACAMHAPERQGARWLIFATIVCLVIGPVVNIIAGIAGVDEAPPEKAALLAKQKAAGKQSAVPDALTRPPNTIQLVAWGVSAATTLFFVLFLRSVGLCFGYESYARLTELYLFFTGLLLAFTFYLLFSTNPEAIPPLILLGLGGGWLASLLGYVALVVGARLLLGVGLERAEVSPLDAGVDLERAEVSPLDA